jgi:acetyl-CoA synthetase
MLIYFSSGTTGMPKMVLHNYSLPLGHIVTAKYWQCVEDDKIHMTQTDSGWAKFAWGKIYGQWICGAAIGAYDTEKFTPQGILDALGRIRPTTFCAPATIFRFLIKEDLSGYDFSYIKHSSVAGEPLSPEVYHKLKELTGLEIREGFGQSETSVMAATFKWLPVKPGSMGKPSPLFGLNLLDENEQSCDDGIVGNISITNGGENPPPGLFTGYWKDEEITRNCWYDGTYHTGDMAWHDGDGYYWFVGRNDDVIKCSGYRIGPFEVESALMEHPSVLECAVTAAPDPNRGQVVKATVVLARGFSPTEELKRELQNHVKRVTAPYKYPRIVEFVDELPKTISGKIQRNVIRKQDGSVIENT